MGLVACPMCTAQLVQSDVDPSAFGREHLANSTFGPLLDPTCLYVCPGCGWWAVRESGWYVQVYGVFDYLVTGVLKNFDLSRKQPLISLLQDRIEGGEEIDAAKCGEAIAEALRLEGHPCEVWRLGSRRGPRGWRKDVYVVEDDDRWLVQVSCLESTNLDPIETLGGFILRGGEIQGLVLRAESAGATGQGSPERIGPERGPFCVSALDPARVLRLVEKDRRVNNPPWLKVLDEESCWAEPQGMSKEFASLLFRETVTG